MPCDQNDCMAFDTSLCSLQNEGWESCVQRRPKALEPTPVSPSNSSDLLCFLAPKHKGMKVSADGLIGRIVRGKRPDRLDRHLLGEMLRNMENVAKRFYSGEVKVVDEFFQLYCLDDDRPDEAALITSVDPEREKAAHMAEIKMGIRDV